MEWKWKLLLGGSVPQMLFFPNSDVQMDLKACSIWSLISDQQDTQYEATIETVDIVTQLKAAPVLHSQIEDYGSGFFFNCLNLTFWVAFVFGVADLTHAGEGPASCTQVTSSWWCSCRRESRSPH